MPNIMLPNLLGAAHDGQDLRRKKQLNALGDMEVARQPVIQQRQDQLYQQGQDDRQVGIDAESAKQGIAAAQFVLQSQSPKAAVLQNFPQLVGEFAKHGVDLNSLDDNGVREYAQGFMEHLSAGQGVGPAQPEAYTLAPGAVRMEGSQQVANNPVQQQPAGYTLSPGDQRFEGSRQVASVPANTPQQQQAPTGFKWNPDGTQAFIPGGPAHRAVTASNRNLRPIPASAATGIIGNKTSLSKIDRAIAAVQANPNAFGLKNYLGDTVMQRADQGGVDPRAKVADIGSLQIHDRSGAAVTASETPRLKPFVPAATDTPEVIVTKLQNLRANLESQVEEAESFYSAESGYRPIQSAEKGQGGSNVAPEGTVISNGQQTLVKRNGQWVPQ